MISRALLLLTLPTVCAFLAVGCGSDGTESPTSPGNDPGTVTGIDLSSYRALVEQVAPPPYQALRREYVDWTTGDYPIIGKVFDENEPMSLYANVQMLDDIIVMIEEAMVDWEHEAEFDSSQGPWEGENEEVVDNQGGECRVVRCEAATPMQGFAAGLIGEEVPLQYRMRMLMDTLPEMELEFGFSQTDTEELLVGYHAYHYPNPDSPESRDTFAFYARRDLVSGAIEIRGVFAKRDVQTQAQDKWIYEIGTEGDSEFHYRMAWYAPDPEFVASVVGGGDKDAEFALRYRQYSNAPGFDAVDPDDPWGDLTQVFGPAFSDLGSSFDAAQEVLCDPAGMFGHGDMPQGLMSSPFPTTER